VDQNDVGLGHNAYFPVGLRFANPTYSFIRLIHESKVGWVSKA
jgi:hypothetical protein